MLAIRMQRTGRRGHAQFRVVVQDSHFSPSSGRVVAQLGNYNPHTKQTALDADKAASYLASGAQPSARVARLFEKEGIKLPDWVKSATKQKRAIRNPDKLRRNRPDEPVAEVAEASDTTVTEDQSTEAQPESEAGQADTKPSDITETQPETPDPTKEPEVTEPEQPESETDSTKS